MLSSTSTMSLVSEQSFSQRVGRLFWETSGGMCRSSFVLSSLVVAVVVVALSPVLLRDRAAAH